MRISTFEQYELAEAVVRAIRCQIRVLALCFNVSVPMQQAEVAALVRDAIEQYCDPQPEADERAAEADRRLTAEYEETGGADARLD